MTKTTRNDRSSEPSCRLLPSMPEAFDDLRMSVDRFCLLAGLESLNEMMSADAEALCGSRHARSGERKGHRWGTTRERDRLPRRQSEGRAPSGAGLRGSGDEPAELGAAVGTRTLASLGDESDGDQRLDPQVCPRGAPAGRCGRRSVGGIG